MEKAIPIKFQFGYAKGRDAIYLDTFIYLKEMSTLELRGEFNSELLTEYNGTFRWIKYQIVFINVKKYREFDFDDYDPVVSSDSSFEILNNSNWMNDNLQKHYKHFRLFTYDSVFEVICESYKVVI
ncbi:MAG: hypothetical protein COB02_13125 [Candidatus Cloacimonadota bacterium]|nr:MAG: hypothetical protein COB02_13125 [Candidatus Cloacimonadota bacterium]